MPNWYWTDGTIPTWVTTSPTATAATSPIFWVHQGASTTVTATATTVTANPWWRLTPYQRDWQTLDQLAAWTDQTAPYQQQQALPAAQAQAYQRYAMGLYRPLGNLFRPSRPALMTHQEEARRDEELYRRAVAEHDEQEAARLLRIVEAHARSAEERQRLIEQQAQAHRETQQRIAAARDRAKELLFEHLTPAQRETVDRLGWFIVEGGKSKTRYRISTRGGAAGNIDVLTKADRVAHRLCCHARSDIPLGDQWLSQKIMLELAEDDFLRLANRHAA